MLPFTADNARQMIADNDMFAQFPELTGVNVVELMRATSKNKMDGSSYEYKRFQFWNQLRVTNRPLWSDWIRYIRPDIFNDEEDEVRDQVVQITNVTELVKVPGFRILDDQQVVQIPEVRSKNVTELKKDNDILDQIPEVRSTNVTVLLVLLVLLVGLVGLVVFLFSNGYVSVNYTPTNYTNDTWNDTRNGTRNETRNETRNGTFWGFFQEQIAADLKIDNPEPPVDTPITESGWFWAACTAFAQNRMKTTTLATTGLLIYGVYVGAVETPEFLWNMGETIKFIFLG
jgi:hypothetical protein